MTKICAYVFMHVSKIRLSGAPVPLEVFFKLRGRSEGKIEQSMQSACNIISTESIFLYV